MKTDKPEITRESIARKLGIDPLNPPMPEGDPDEIDDASPSIWAPLTKEEVRVYTEAIESPDPIIKKMKNAKLTIR